MSILVKLVSVVAVSIGFSTVTTIPAHALSIISPAYEGQAEAQGSDYGNAPVAFTGGVAQSANSSGLSLSAQEIKHVTWCAKTYTSYHATDNSYQTKQGSRTECRSPY
ncbi:BA14K family protein [Agrobacterium sp. lyk4-40-TYG-31]|jgi:hypothetical protein|uniref:BA14K family protein n=1 Tax=Agrobacterium sp. lyk4-40-TYG-31 TaxID=3040276 RepID=UPI002551C406|nr:BA14K family protein [Agrobacterium sp. lyk4-40-TYG-31]